MKTLLINIYRDITSIYPNTEIFNAGKDNILDGFYISLGMAIAEGVSVGEYKSLVVDFAVAKPTEFELFQKQWDELKLALLGDTPKGEYTFQLPSEYLEWLKINASTVYYKKYQGQHQASIRLDIEELYEDTVDAIRRKVLRFLQENDNYKNFDEFVVNDNIVNRRSKLVRAIKDKYEDNIAFVLYEKWKEDVLTDSSSEYDNNANDDSVNKSSTCNKADKGSIDKENMNSVKHLDVVVVVENCETVKYITNGEEHFDTSGNRIVRFCRKNGLLLDTREYIPMNLGEGETFAYLAINSANNMLCKIDTYGITPICDYSNGMIKNGSHYDGKLSKFNYSSYPEKIAKRIGEYLLLESSSGLDVVYEDKKNKVEICDINLAHSKTIEKQPQKQDRHIDRDIELITIGKEPDHTNIIDVYCENGTWGYTDMRGEYHVIPFSKEKYHNARIFSSCLIIISLASNFDYNSTKTCSLYNIINNKVFDYPNLQSGQILPLSSNYYRVRYWNKQEQRYYNKLHTVDGTLIHDFDCDTLFVIE